MMRIRDTDLHVQIDAGPDPLVWAHGMMASMENEDALGIMQWQNWQDDTGRGLIRYDARGHGDSAPGAQVSDYLWSNLGQDMLAVALAAQASRFIAGGSSMGCATAIHAALAFPQQIAGLVLMLPPRLWEAREQQARVYQRASRLAALLGQMKEGNNGGGLPAWLTAAAPMHARAAMRCVARLDDARLAQLFAAAAASNLPPRETLAPLASIPTLILGWTGDAAHPVASAEELHRLLPHAALFIAHDYQQAMTIAARIRRFAASLPLR